MEIKQMGRLKRNFLYSTALTIANYLFPIVVFPYVARTLGAYNLGICNFTENVILYFTMFSMMGMGVLGIREVASVQEDKEKLSSTFSSLFGLNLLFTLASVSVLLVCIYCVPQLNQYKSLMYVGIVNIIANFLLIDWFYKGIENFAYITKRTIAVKAIYIIAVFAFVRQPEDYFLYYAITTATIVINAAINLIHSQQYVHFTLQNMTVAKYVRPNMRLGAYWILTTLYTSFYTLLLGFVSTPDQIGYFTTASKLVILTMSFYTAWTSVAMPRASAMLASNQSEPFRELINRSILALFGFAIPAIIFGIVYSPDIIWILAGNGYEGASTPCRIIMPLIFIIGYSQIAIIQVLIPQKCDSTLLRNAIIGALTGITLGFALVPKLEAVGASIAWLVSEMTVLTLSLIHIQRNIHIPLEGKYLFKQVAWHLPTLLVCLLIYRVLPSLPTVRIGIAGIFITVYTIILQIYILRNPLFRDLSRNLVSIYNRKIGRI